jgi:heme/copper-type cytochrome/quinol oxidase subunit 2
MKKSTILAILFAFPILLNAQPKLKQVTPVKVQDNNDVFIFIGFVLFIFIHLAAFLLITDIRLRRAEKLKQKDEMELDRKVREQLPAEISFSMEQETELEAI